MNFLRGAYIFAIAVLLGLFVGFGIAAFYQAPEFEGVEPPTPPGQRVIVYPLPPSPVDQDYYESPEYQEWLEEQQELREAHYNAMKDYHRNVFIIAYTVGLLFIILGTLIRPRLDIIRPGLILGGLGTMIYALSQGFGDMSSVFRFSAIAVSLIVLICLGYRTLIERKSAQEV